MLVHLPGSNRTRELRDGLIQAFAGLPRSLGTSLTWDQGTEMSQRAEFAAASDHDNRLKKLLDSYSGSSPDGDSAGA